jgi:head-tail adaptor
MLIDRPGAPVYLLRARTRLDTYGDPVEDWDDPERILIPGAVIQSVASTEEGGDLTHTRNLFCRGALDVTAEDRIEAEGQVWRVDGDARVRHGLSVGTYTRLRLSHPERRVPNG